jgi:phenylalanyl-tRNA synthetase beta chain
MKISWKWLNRFIDLSGINPEDIVDRLALLGLEVESINTTYIQSSDTKDIVLDVTSTANRSDTLSVIGIAREISLLLNKPMKEENYELANMEFVNKTIQLKDYTNLCEGYILSCIDNVELNNSPSWIQDLLVASGIEVQGNIDDLTTFITLETGFPLSFINCNSINNPIVLKYPDSLYRFTGENDIEYEISPSLKIPCISYNNNIINLCGILNSKEQSEKLLSQSIILQGILFPPHVVRKSSKLLNINNLASQRYERGLSSSELENAFRRALFLITNVLGGKVQYISSINKKNDHSRNIKININRIMEVLGPLEGGYKLSSSKIIEILNSLGFTIEPLQNENCLYYTVKPPSFRYYDIQREIDVIEEIARLYGFNSFLDKLPRANHFINRSLKESFCRKLRSSLKTLGMNEVLNYSLESQNQKFIISNPINKIKTLKLVQIQNPLSSEFNILRQNLLNNILSVINYNQKQGNGILECYEIARTFKKEQNAYIENYKIAGVLQGEISVDDWLNNKMPSNWFYAKSIVEQILNLTDAKVEWLPPHSDDPSCILHFFHPYRVAKLLLNNIFLGYFGELHPSALKSLDVKKRSLYGFEFDLKPLINLYIKNSNFSNKKAYLPYSTYPSMLRDISIVIPEYIQQIDIQNHIEKITEPLLYKLKFINYYTGNPIPTGFKSLSFRLFYRAGDRTLTVQEVDALHNKLYNELNSIFAKNK